MPTSQNRVIFEHTLAGSKNLLRIKPVRSDGIDTSFTDFVDIIAGDISDVDLLSDQGATYSGFVTENSIGGVITGFTPAEDLLQIE
ncbi:hypothetical protein H8D85_00930 [bacterium]|nr:hypothetical protein [bacterium]